MASLRGERFDIDLSSDEEHVRDQGNSRHPASAVSLVKDIQERPETGQKTAQPPVLKSHQHGFPSHTKRAPQSRWKARRAADASGNRQVHNATSSRSVTDPVEPNEHSRSKDTIINEQREIDLENQQKLASMSDDEIAQERAELLQGLDPKVVEALLQRNGSDRRSSDNADATIKSTPPPPGKRVESLEASDETTSHSNAASKDISTSAETYEASNVHFPKPTQPIELDPEDPSFLDNLHTKYFPSLPSEPSKLSWMRSSSEKIYDPKQDSVRIAELRFDFQGALLAPRKASHIPVTAGLHHHGDAPESAGYTVPELAHLARSSVPMQRCIAFQTLGRLMYRLGIGEFGDSKEQIPKGLWRMLTEGRVLDTLQEAANSDARHVSAKAHATEAIWLWRRGGGSSIDAV